MVMVFNYDLVSLIQSVLLIISAILIIIASVGILNLDKKLPNVVYARIHILGIIDIAGVIAFLGLGQPLFALIYFILAPFLAHAMANAYFHGEDQYNNSATPEDEAELLENDVFGNEDAQDLENASIGKNLDENSEVG